MSDDDRQALGHWWRTAIIQTAPGVIRVRGYPIEQLIGRITFPAMVWLMLRGDLPTPGQASLLEAALVASVDHGPHAPSIAVARMAITCGLGINGAMASGINTLGDIHGGAGQQCMELYRSIVDAWEAGESLEDAVRRIVDRHLAAGGAFLPGFGHRFHPVDPRAGRLLALVDRASEAGVVSGRFARVGRAVEADLLARKGRHIPMNIDGVTAVVCAELGFEPPLARGLFILSRSVGILAHAWEQSGQGERIKGPMPPQFDYTYEGPAPRDFTGGEGAGPEES
jgi:citrate synthase